jgi:hypothetical protein
MSVCVKQEMERPPDDCLYGQRIHAWVMVLPGKRGISEGFFIEPLTGLVQPTDTINGDSNPGYLGIESVWNNSNYWVNMQDCSSGVEVTTTVLDGP